MKFIPWNKDKWLSKEGSILPYDKLEHFLIALGLIPFLVIYIDPTFFGLLSVALVSFLIIGWEIRDSFLTGFSWKDLIAGFLGMFSFWIPYISYKVFT